MKIIATVKEEKRIEKEINLPYYFKSGTGHYKVASESNAIKVETLPGYFAITATNPEIFQHAIAYGTPLEEIEFETALQDVSEKIKQAIDQSLQTA